MASSSVSSSIAATRYNLGINPPYQINYRAKRAGKHISASKRRVTFQFGFSSAKAISGGLVEKDCRGEEHEIVLIWSHVTGKRQLFMDSREIHMSKVSGGNTKFEHSWSAFGHHTMKIVANATPPKQTSGERQFDLFLDGMSFFDFSKIYQLGRSPSQSAKFDPTYSYRGMAYDSRDDEEEEEDEVEPPPMPVVKIDLFDTQPSSSPSSIYNSMPSLVGSSTSSNSISSYDEFTPVEHNTQKTFQSVSNEILCAYNNKAPDVSKSALSSSRALVPVSEEGMDQISKSMTKLVNLDDITTSAMTPITPNSPSLNTMKKGEANWGLVGRAPTLAEIRESVAQPPLAPTMATVQTQPTHGYYTQPTHGYYGAPTNMGSSAY